MTVNDDSLFIEVPLWRWMPKGAEDGVIKGGWFFVTITNAAADHARARAFERRATGQKSGFGSVPVKARIGNSDFTTSLFPHRESGGYILPIKAAIRRAEDLTEGDMVRLSLWL